jgi:tetratricopeptide (TPR) repeat protein
VYPVVEVAARSATFALGANAVASGAADPWLRWNNYGIAALDQQQYLEAEAAFRHVVELRPDYADGWTNVAIADFSYQNYAAASQALERALALAPGDLRATFFSAMVDQAEGRFNPAATKFLAVLDAYPRLLLARQQLGAIYYQQSKLALARDQYEAIQAIDPDDLGAHYNLARIYRRLGLKEKAAQQAAYFNDRKFDPSANAFAENFLRTHPDVANESVPYHLHLAPNATPENALAPASKDTSPRSK